MPSDDNTMLLLLDKRRGAWSGDPARGAAMGRPTVSSYYDKRSGENVEITVNEHARPFNLRRITLNSGGYDSGGAYWGHGEPLWGFVGPITDIHGFVRAKNREAAKEEIRKLHPLAKFYK